MKTFFATVGFITIVAEAFLHNLRTRTCPKCGNTGVSDSFKQGWDLRK